MSERPTIHLGPTGDPDQFNESTLLRPGELGKSYWKGQRRYQRVQLDSSATASTPVGAVAANQTAYWKDKSNYLVTNDSRFAESVIAGGVSTTAYRNDVAGVFRVAATAGNYCDVLQKGNDINIAGKAGITAVAGESAIASDDVDGANIDRVAVGTAPTHQKLGVIRGPLADGVVPVDVDIPAAPNDI